MAVYKVNIKPSVNKDFKPIPDKDLKKIVKRIQALAVNPRPPGCEKLTTRDRYRIRQGDYRILYTIDDNELIIRVLQVGHRRDIYRISEQKAGYETGVNTA